MSGFRFALWTVALVLLTAGCGVATVAPPLDPQTRGQTGCAGQYGGVTQAMNGHVWGCLQVGSIAARPYTVVFEQALDFRTVKPPITVPPSAPPSVRKLLNPDEPPVALTVSPASGKPGTAVTINGRITGRGPIGYGHANFCWDGCRFGLQYDGVAISWTSRHTFRARLVVPDAPWFEGDPVRVAPLTSGSYRIGLQCLVLGKLCSWDGVEGVTRFHLRVSAPPTWCRTAASCGSLQATPSTASPGEVVSVTGFAPLASIDGSSQPFALGLDMLTGRPHGPELRFTEFKAIPSALIGQAELDVLAPPSFASLTDTVPAAELSAGSSPISAQPGDPSTVAWCAPGAVNLSSAGATVSISTRRVGALLARMGFASESPLQCDAVALAGPPSDPARVVAAAFPAAPKPYGAPPFGAVALLMQDRGRRWTALPVPRGANPLSFGGFRYTDGGVEAVYASALPNRKAPEFPNLDPTKPLAELSSNGGVRWRSSPLGCPTAGPCVTLGPYLQGTCAMDETAQPLLRSTDGGIRWSPVSSPDQVQACAEAELVATSPDSDLLIDSMSQFPLQVTTDGGASWQVIGLPAAPGEQSFFLAAGGRSYVLGEGPGGITVLPSGDLLLTGGQGYKGDWDLLRHGSDAWCAVRGVSVRLLSLPQLSSVTVIGSSLWWLTGPRPAIRRVALSDISC